MLLGDAWDNYKDLNKAFSDNARKLAFGATVISWFFRIEVKTADSTDIDFPFLIVLALFFITLFFLFDISQYFVQTLRWRQWIRKKQLELLREPGVNELDKNMNITKPRNLDNPALLLLYCKTVMLCISFLFIMLHFIKMIFT